MKGFDVWVAPSGDDARVAYSAPESGTWLKIGTLLELYQAERYWLGSKRSKSEKESCKSLALRDLTKEILQRLEAAANRR